MLGSRNIHLFLDLTSRKNVGYLIQASKDTGLLSVSSLMVLSKILSKFEGTSDLVNL